MRAQYVLSYHLIKVPWIRACCLLIPHRSKSIDGTGRFVSEIVCHKVGASWGGFVLCYVFDGELRAFCGEGFSCSGFFAREDNDLGYVYRWVCLSLVGLVTGRVCRLEDFVCISWG